VHQSDEPRSGEARGQATAPAGRDGRRYSRSLANGAGAQRRRARVRHFRQAAASRLIVPTRHSSSSLTRMLSSAAAEDFATPARDELKRRGTTFLNHYIGSAMCTPSRGVHVLPASAAGERRIRPNGKAMCRASGPTGRAWVASFRQLGTARPISASSSCAATSSCPGQRELHRCSGGLWVSKPSNRRRQSRRPRPGYDTDVYTAGESGALAAHPRPGAEPAGHILAPCGQLHLAARYHVRRRQPAWRGGAEVADRENHAAARQRRFSTRWKSASPSALEVAGRAGPCRVRSLSLT